MNNQLEDIRKEIDAIDENIIDLLGKRFAVVRKIGSIKKEHGLPVLDEKRRQYVLSTRITKGASLILPISFIERVFNLIHEYSLKTEKES